MGLSCDTCGFTKKDYEKCNCPICNGINWIDEDIVLIRKIANDTSFIQAMIDLKEKDIIEYNLKISQFKAQLAQQESIKQDSKPKCPKCKSTSITTGARGVNFTWGLIGASKTVNRCASCGHTWKP